MDRLIKRFSFLVFLALLPLVITGCAETLLATSLGVAAWQGHRIETDADAEDVAKVDIDQTETAAMAVAEEMGITISGREQEKIGEVLLIGSSPRHEKVHIILSSFSNKMTKVQARARKSKIGIPFTRNKDYTYAEEIVKAIKEKCRGGTIANKGDSDVVDAVTGATIQISNIREGPGANYRIVAVAPKGAELIFLNEEGNWLKVKLVKTGRIGYIYNTLVRPNGI
ncbi:MAG: SH3 domain-containing protein [Candidatus Portnoybacteria bacterium]|nr:SH3 domain-containing protein [Candidatus Portnoybacteria bacterium]